MVDALNASCGPAFWLKVGTTAADVMMVSQLDWRGKHLTSSDSQAICAVIDAGMLTSIGEGGLDLRENNIDGAGWAAIIAGVCGNKDSKIHTIDASGKNIGAQDAKVISDALRTSVCTSLTQLDLSGNQLCGLNRFGRGTYDATGIKAIADALRVNALLTSLETSLGTSLAKFGAKRNTHVQMSTFFKFRA